VHFYEDDGLDRAAAVAFYSLLSLAPLVYLLSLLAGWVLPGSDLLRRALRNTADFLPPEVVPVVDRGADLLTLSGSLFWLAIPGLVWVATTAFTGLEYAVNVAFGTVPLRRFWLSRLKAFSVVSAAAVLFLIAHGVNQATVWLAPYQESLNLPPIVSGGTALVTYAVLLVVTFLAFTLFYKILPRGPIAWRPCLLSAFLALVFWELARRLFSSFLERSPSYGLPTGALAGTVAFLLWVYTSVAIILYGAELAAVLNGNRGAESGG
jgi:membrane protein